MSSNDMLEILRKCIICNKELRIKVLKQTENFTVWEFLVCDDCDKKEFRED